eukprot:CAMPEP_0194205880 /NCGR_PEP_ID=MMETSP0156-20130528/5057_1 /TAXON_ID=33649 /ORGANISM="Thalassionema nitzschioides, Strain L26-B" /LENGTH=699 /DNA_ID=CAMNT_0038932265 /DNA_START=130 /DNA_END=2225 /DNA_ORIENTATION=+
MTTTTTRTTTTTVAPVTKAPSSELKLAASTKSLTNPSHNLSETSTLEMIDEVPTYNNNNETTVQHKTPLQEEEGQELLWIEDREQITEGQELVYVNNDDQHSNRNNYAIVKKKMKNNNKKKGKINLRRFFSPRHPKQRQVAIVPHDENDTNHQLALQKATHARQLLQEALSSTDDNDENRDATANLAFTEAMDARRLLSADDDDDDDEELKWLETKALGEKEAQQAIRNGKKTGQEQNNNNPLSPNSMMQAAEQHAEQARKYLESMLPEFLSAVSSSDSGGDAAAAAAVSNNKARKKQNNNLRSPKSKTRKQTPRQREELIARVVQENNHGAMASPAISTLGFDNTFDTKSLGDIMDGPSTTPQSKETLSKMLQHMKQQKKKQEQQTNTKSTEQPASQQLTSPARRARIEKFVATVVPGEAELTPADKTKLHEIQQLDQLVDGRLTAAAEDDDACSLSSYHGVPQHDLNRPDARTSGKRLPQQQPTFVTVGTRVKVQPQLLSARSWEDMADGNASLEEVVEKTHPKKETNNANANDDDEKENRKKKGIMTMRTKKEKLTPSSSSKNNNKKKSKLLSPALWLRRRNKNQNNPNNNINNKQQPEAAPNPKPSNNQKSSTPNNRKKVPNDLPRTISITPSNNVAPQSSPMFVKPSKPMTSPDENNEDRYISLTELQDNDNDDDDDVHAEALSEPDLDRYEVT